MKAKMASQGEISYRLFISKLVQKATSRYVSVVDTQNLGSYFWSMVSEEFKREQREQHKRKAFWNFALCLKEYIVHQKMEELFEMWLLFDLNGKNMWETLYENSITHQVNCIL